MKHTVHKFLVTVTELENRKMNADFDVAGDINILANAISGIIQKNDDMKNMFIKAVSDAVGNGIDVVKFTDHSEKENED